MIFILRFLIINIIIIIIFAIVLKYYNITFPIDINQDVKIIKFIAREFNIKECLATDIVKISKLENVDPLFIAALIYTESSFNEKALSPKNYYGLMQINKNIEYRDVNILYGIKIFKEKLNITKGDFEKAIILYKGYKNMYDRGKHEARKVLSYFYNVKNKWEEEI